MRVSSETQPATKKVVKKFGVSNFLNYLCSPKPLIRELSSAGSEHLPYKQRVGGSNPSAPTRLTDDPNGSSVFLYIGQSRVGLSQSA